MHSVHRTYSQSYSTSEHRAVHELKEKESRPKHKGGCKDLTQ
jgi:hypothetical protein